MDELLDHIQRGARLMNAPDDLPPSATETELALLRTPPHSTEAEQSVLGALLIDSRAFSQISDKLTVSDFYEHAHKLTFDAVASLVGDGKPVDVVTVFDRLGDQAEQAGGLSYLNAMAQSVPNAGNIVRHAEIVIERATLRSVVSLANLATERAFRNEPAAEVLDDLKVQFGRLQDARKLGSSRLPLLRPSQLREHAQATQWLVKHIVPADSIGMIFGASQAFKSFVALDAALHIAHGLTWLGRRTRKGHVIYIAAEGGGGVWKRIEAWHKARRLTFDDDVQISVLPIAVDLRVDAWKVVEAAQGLGITPAMVVVDTVSQTYSGEENSASDMASYLRELGTRFRALWHCAVALLHHTGHSATERPRGSSAILANLDWAHGVFRDEKEMLATLTCAKQKDVDPFSDMTFSLTVQALGTDEDGDKVTSLVARHLTSAEELQEVMETESKAGRGGKNQLLLGLLQSGSKEADLRKAFYEQCGLDTTEARRQAYHRAKKWAEQNGFMEVSEGYVLTLKSGA